jgi:hypothetical protein
MLRAVLPVRRPLPSRLTRPRRRIATAAAAARASPQATGTTSPTRT